jgi:iron complex outermembrane recepter protein
VGGAWTGARSYIGASFAYDDIKYGIPVLPHDDDDDDDDHDDDGHDDDDHDDVPITLTPTRQAFTLRAGARELNGLFSSYRATLGVKQYEHTEFEGDEVGTIFNNDTLEGELLGSHRAFGRLSGTLGGWFLNRSFEAVGPEALSPPIDQRGMAMFLYEEVTWPHLTMQFGGRLDRTVFEPLGDLPDRDFTEFSGSLGLLFRPAAANDNFVLAASLARAARNPALEELYFYGPHPGNLAFEIGNPDLESERALGVDVSLRARAGRFKGEFTVFRNDIRDFIFRNPLTEDEFEDREEEFEDRFGHSDDDGGDHAHGGEFPFVEFVGADSVLWGFEAHGDLDLTSNLFLEVGYDWVRGQLKATNRPLPRIPPFRVITGLRYQRNAFQVGGSATMVGEQTRVFGAETTTDGYTMLRAFASYSFNAGGALNTITARLDNATDTLYRNHLNYLKDELPEIGRNFKLVYTVRF